MTDKERNMFVDAYRFFEKHCCSKMTAIECKTMVQDIVEISEKHYNEPLVLDVLTSIVKYIERNAEKNA